MGSGYLRFERLVDGRPFQGRRLALRAPRPMEGVSLSRPPCPVPAGRCGRGRPRSLDRTDAGPASILSGIRLCEGSDPVPELLRGPRPEGALDGGPQGLLERRELLRPALLPHRQAGESGLLRKVPPLEFTTRPAEKRSGLGPRLGCVRIRRRADELHELARLTIVELLPLEVVVAEHDLASRRDADPLVAGPARPDLGAEDR